MIIWLLAIGAVSLATGLTAGRKKAISPEVTSATPLAPLLGREFSVRYEPAGYFQLNTSGVDTGSAGDISVERSVDGSAVTVGQSAPDPTSRMKQDASEWLQENQRRAYESITPETGVLTTADAQRGNRVRASRYGLPRGGEVIFSRSGTPGVVVVNGRSNRGHQERIALLVRASEPNVIVVTRPPEIGDVPVRDWMVTVEPGQRVTVITESRDQS